MHYTMQDLRNVADAGSVRLFLDGSTGIVDVSWTVQDVPIRAKYGPDISGIYDVRLEHLADLIELMDKIKYGEKPMAWEWSHAAEAYEIARKRLYTKSKEWLSEVWAEWECDRIVKEDPESETDPYTDGTYDRIKKLALLERSKGDMVDDIWSRMEEKRTCTNGGHALWACPEGCGCHLISVDDITEDELESIDDE